MCLIFEGQSTATFRARIQALPKSLMDIIVQRSPEMRQYINIKTLVPYLNKYKILTSVERQQLLNMQATREEKVDLLIEILESKSGESKENFLKALKEAHEHTGHEDLLKILETDRTPTYMMNDKYLQICMQCNICTIVYYIEFSATHLCCFNITFTTVRTIHKFKVNKLQLKMVYDNGVIK